MEAKTELDRQKELLRLLFRGFQSRKRGQEAQLEVVRVEKRRRAKSEAGRRVELRNWGEKGVEHKPRGLGADAGESEEGGEFGEEEKCGRRGGSKLEFSGERAVI